MLLIFNMNFTDFLRGSYTFLRGNSAPKLKLKATEKTLFSTEFCVKDKVAHSKQSRA